LAESTHTICDDPDCVIFSILPFCYMNAGNFLVSAIRERPCKSVRRGPSAKGKIGLTLKKSVRCIGTGFNLFHKRRVISLPAKQFSANQEFSSIKWVWNRELWKV
jgi:hypothetical protein